MAKYWIGQDGNIWLADQHGTRNMGVASADVTRPDETGFYDPWADAGETPIRFEASRIADPMVGNVLGSGTSAPRGGGGSASAPQYKDTTALRNATQAGLSALDTAQNNRLSAEDIAYNNLMSRYDTEKSTERGKYTDQVTGNEKALSTGNQAAMLAAAQGGRGLRATLAAMGALGGTGAVLADRAIMDSANKDLGGATENFETNAKTLQTAWGDFEKLDEDRRQEAGNIRNTNRQAVEADILTNRQKLLQDMASYWEQAGNQGEYGNYMGQATALTPEIAARSRSRAEYTPVQGGFKPGELSNYLAGARDMTVGRQTGAQAGPALNNPLYALSRKREEELV